MKLKCYSRIFFFIFYVCRLFYRWCCRQLIPYEHRLRNYYYGMKYVGDSQRRDVTLYYVFNWNPIEAVMSAFKTKFYIFYSFLLLQISYKRHFVESQPFLSSSCLWSQFSSHLSHKKKLLDEFSGWKIYFNTPVFTYSLLTLLNLMKAETLFVFIMNSSYINNSLFCHHTLLFTVLHTRYCKK